MDDRRKYRIAFQTVGVGVGGGGRLNHPFTSYVLRSSYSLSL